MEIKWFCIMMMCLFAFMGIEQMYQHNQRTERVKYIMENIDKVSLETRTILEREICHIMNIEK